MRWLLRLYPPAWRRRYEDEMAALLQEQRTGSRTALDLLRGAADAWLIGPRGPFGGLEMWLAIVAFAITNILVAVARPLAAPLGLPWDMVEQLVFWSLFIVLTSWLSQQPASRCSLHWPISWRRR